MRVAVTGSEGFIGNHVMQVLKNERHTGVGYDRAGEPDNKVELTTYKGDFGACDVVIHLAAHADVRNNWDNLDAIEADNHEALMSTLHAAYQSNVKRFIFMSTGAVYANCVGFVTEDMPCVATSPYAASKLAGEAYVQAYAEKCGWKWYAVRPSACVGSGYQHGHIADFVRKYRTVGEVFALDDGRRPRDSVHVRDVAETLVQLASGTRQGGIYNVSGGQWGWKNTLRVMQKMLGKDIPNACASRPLGWLGDSYGAEFNCDKLRKAGLTPARSIEEGVVEALTSLGWPG